MPDTTGKKSIYNSFHIYDRESCARAIRNGGVAALIQAGITAVFAILGLFTSASEKNLNYFLDPSGLLDATLIVVLAVFVFRKSRVASTLLPVYFAACKAIMWSELGAPSSASLMVTILLLAYYVTAMRGTYAWRSSYRYLLVANSAPDKTPEPIR